MSKFLDFNMNEATNKFIELNKFTEPTPIQAKVIPAALKHQDVIGLSRTGTGKTHAYLIPLMEMVHSDSNEVQAVITAPTRELAMQIFEKAKMMCEVDPEIRIGLYIGGKDREKDIKQLSGKQPHIAIGTPGRIKDLFLTEGVLRLDKGHILIVDEADMTLEYGFLDDIDAFAGRMDENLQMLAFSATMPEQLKPFLRRYMHNPVTFKIGEDARINPNIQHILVPCYHYSYSEVIQSILPGFQPYVCLIFCNTREDAAKIAQDLRDKHLDVTELHGDLESRKRKQAMREIANSTNTYVVATDLAARGIDLDTVTHVISCGFPEELEFYIHRAGRTARGGSTGYCFALYKEGDDGAIRSLMRQGIHFEHRRFHNGTWNDLRPYGQRPKKKDDEMEKEIAKMMTKKNAKVKPGYKKKRKAAIEKIERRKKREFIRSKIKEEKTARYKAASRAKRNGDIQ